MPVSYASTGASCQKEIRMGLHSRKTIVINDEDYLASIFASDWSVKLFCCRAATGLIQLFGIWLSSISISWSLAYFIFVPVIVGSLLSMWDLFIDNRLLPSAQQSEALNSFTKFIRFNYLFALLIGLSYFIYSY